MTAALRLSEPQVVLNFSNVVGLLGSGGLLASPILVILTVVGGYLLGKLGEADSWVQALGAGQRTITAVMVVATMNFCNDEVVMVVVYSLIVWWSWSRWPWNWASAQRPPKQIRRTQPPCRAETPLVRSWFQQSPVLPAMHPIGSQPPRGPFSGSEISCDCSGRGYCRQGLDRQWYESGI